MTQALSLVLLRHGQSEWNAAGVFTGWENASLTAVGEEEATRAGLLLAAHDLLPAFAHTSLQHRTIRTAELALTAADRDWIPVRRSWRLNGRHYGALQGRRKAQERHRDQAVHGPRLRRIDNELYTDPKTGTLFSDAKAGLAEIIAAVKTLVAS